MPEPSELQVILSVAEQLAEELGAGADPEAAIPSGHDHLESLGPSDTEKAAQVARLGRALARIAAAAAGPAGGYAEEVSTPQVAAALDRTELVMRGEIMRGNEALLREQLPGFVFLVVLPGSGMDRALELAKRARAQLDEALG